MLNIVEETNYANILLIVCNTCLLLWVISKSKIDAVYKFPSPITAAYSTEADLVHGGVCILLGNKKVCDK